MSRLSASRQYLRMKNSALIFSIRLAAAIFGLLIKKSFQVPNGHYVQYFQKSNLLPNKNDRFYKWDEAWGESDRAWNRGEYLGAVKMRSEIMHEVYEAQNLRDGYFPPFLSDEFAGPFGHNAVAGMHIAGQAAGLLPSGKRLLCVNAETAARPFLQSLSSDIELIPHKSPEWTVNPSQWHLAERQQMFRQESGFIDLYPLFESIFSQKPDSEMSPILKLPNNYETSALTKLRELGLKSEDWFVTFHARDTGAVGEVREQSIHTYRKAMQYVLEVGGKVIRVGDPSMAPLPDLEGVIDLCRDFKHRSKLHLYALAKAKFFVGTNSGPKMYPPLYGVPSLITNLTSIGLEAFTFTPNTVYMPKQIQRNGVPVSYLETMTTHIGFDNFNASELAKRGLVLVNNSDDEILGATREMNERLSGDGRVRSREMDALISDIRAQAQFSSGGNFSSFWLNKNADWFLGQR